MVIRNDKNIKEKFFQTIDMDVWIVNCLDGRRAEPESASFTFFVLEAKITAQKHKPMAGIEPTIF